MWKRIDGGVYQSIWPIASQVEFCSIFQPSGQTVRRYESEI